jgi:hypothetical protein
MKNKFMYGIKSIYYSTSLNNRNSFILYKSPTLSNQFLTILNLIYLKPKALNKLEGQSKLLFNSCTKSASCKRPIKAVKGHYVKTSMKEFLKKSNQPFPIVINKINQKIRKFLEKQILATQKKVTQSLALQAALLSKASMLALDKIVLLTQLKTTYFEREVFYQLYAQSKLLPLRKIAMFLSETKELKGLLSVCKSQETVKKVFLIGCLEQQKSLKPIAQDQTSYAGLDLARFAHYNFPEIPFISEIYLIKNGSHQPYRYMDWQDPFIKLFRLIEAPDPLKFEVQSIIKQLSCLSINDSSFQSVACKATLLSKASVRYLALDKKEKVFSILFGKKRKINLFLNNKNPVFPSIYCKMKSFLKILIESDSRQKALIKQESSLKPLFLLRRLNRSGAPKPLSLTSSPVVFSGKCFWSQNISPYFLTKMINVKYFLNPCFFFVSINIWLFFIRKRRLLNLLRFIDIYNIGGKNWLPNLIVKSRFLNKRSVALKAILLSKASMLALDKGNLKLKNLNRGSLNKLDNQNFKASIKSLFFELLSLKKQDLKWFKPSLISNYNFNLVRAYFTFSIKSTGGQKNFIVKQPKAMPLLKFLSLFLKENQISELDSHQIKRENGFNKNSFETKMKQVFRKKPINLFRLLFKQKHYLSRASGPFKKKELKYSLYQEKKKQYKIIWSWLIKRFSKFSMFSIASQYWLFLSTNHLLTKPSKCGFSTLSFDSFGVKKTPKESKLSVALPHLKKKKDLVFMKLEKTNFYLWQNLYGFKNNKGFLVPLKKGSSFVKESQISKKTFLFIKNLKEPFFYYTIYKPLDTNGIKKDPLNLLTSIKKASNIKISKKESKVICSFQLPKKRSQKYLLIEHVNQNLNSNSTKGQKKPFAFFSSSLNQQRNFFFKCGKATLSFDSFGVKKTPFESKLSVSLPHLKVFLSGKPLLGSSKARTKQGLKGAPLRFSLRLNRNKKNQTPLRNTIQKMKVWGLTNYLLTYKQRKSFIKFSIGLHLTKTNLIHSFEKEIFPFGFSVLTLGSKKSNIEQYPINKRKNLSFLFDFENDLSYLKPSKIFSTFISGATAPIRFLLLSKASAIALDKSGAPASLSKNQFSFNHVWDLTKKEKFYEIWRNQDQNNSFRNFINF